MTINEFAIITGLRKYDERSGRAQNKD